MATHVRARTDHDLDACMDLAGTVQRLDGYPPRLPRDLGAFLARPDALGAWVAEGDGGIVGHVALHPSSSPAVMGLAATATGRPAEQLAVVARLLVAPGYRRAGLGRTLLTVATEAAHASGRWPVLDVATHFTGAIEVYERAGWTCAGQVSVPFGDGPPLEELVYVGPPA